MAGKGTIKIICARNFPYKYKPGMAVQCAHYIMCTYKYNVIHFVQHKCYCQLLGKINKRQKRFETHSARKNNQLQHCGVEKQQNVCVSYILL